MSTEDPSHAERLSSHLFPLMAQIEALLTGRPDGGHSIAGRRTGIHALDTLLGGLHGGDLVIVAGRPSMGKSALLRQFVTSLAVEHQIPVALYSLDASPETTVTRILASEARVDMRSIREGGLTDEEVPRLARVAGLFTNAPLFLYGGTSRRATDLLSSIRHVVRETGARMVGIDPLGAISTERMREGQQEYRPATLSGVARELKSLAVDLNISIVATSSVGSAVERRAGDSKRPQLSDLTEVGSPDEPADVVLFLHRPELYEGPIDRDGNSLEGMAEIIVGKHRHGPVGFVHVYFSHRSVRFENFV
jgi:replicative DNA helicase